jgi:hypothetical protein
LEQWYFSQCNEDWEHSYGIEIGTLDNPGWYFKIDLTDIDIESNKYTEYYYSIGDDAKTSGNNWIDMKLKDGKFVGYGDPHRLNELVKIFLKWAKANG